MKTIKIYIAAITSALLFSSCSFQLYSTKTMAENYAMRMNTEEELAIKSKVKIFLNENDVKGEYEVLSFMTHKPFALPIFMSVRKETIKKFYEKAVTKAHELGGNGIIITGGGYCKVINLKNWVADDISSAQFINVIFNSTLMDKFLNGEVAKLAKNSEKKRKEKEFQDEIESNISNAEELKEVEFIRKKIDALESYNSSLAKPKSSISKTIKELRKEIKKTEKKIKAKINRKAKKSAKASAK